MTNRIRPLMPLVINQIAAGEVIERPASVLKELLENAIDAQSSEITIDIEDSGLSRICVRDNGHGIHPDDLTLAIASHTTSKITQLEDLNRTISLGFRGEALASIAAISKLALTSKCAASLDAWQIKVEGGETKAYLPASHEQGCTVEVNQLFYNTPVRKKFLSSYKTELHHIETMIKRIALSHFGIRFTVRYQQKQTWNLSSAESQLQQENRLVKLLGRSFLKNAMYIECALGSMTLKGWVALPSLNRKQSDWQYFYINNRFVRDKLVLHAIKQAYGDYLSSTEQPSYVLYLSLDPAKVDVNVHPTKSEVRFEDGRYIHDFIFNRISKALASPSKPLFHSQEPQQTSLPISSSWNNYQALLDTVENRKKDNSFNPYRIVGLCHERYLVVEVSKGLMALDMDEVRRHLDYTEYVAAVQSQSVQSYPLLIPQTIHLTSNQSEKMIRFLPVANKLGLSIHHLSEYGFVVRKAPKPFAHQDFKTLLFPMLETMMTLDSVDLISIIGACMDKVCYPKSEEEWCMKWYEKWKTIGKPLYSYRKVLMTYQLFLEETKTHAHT